jgi:dihydrofolate synthase / folylpolyglutamate synthase
VSPDPKPDTLAAWLDYLERLHPKTIALGLERVAAVRDALRLRPSCPLVVVGGTNGKGSTCAMMEAMLDAAGYRVGLYTSPHLLRYNERVRIGRVAATDAELCAAFAAVEAARGDVPLTYFEFGTLAAVWHFERSGVEAAVLEVGLGGRLDAVNAFDADCAVVTGVALDHTEFLGPDRESIGREKAGIYRAGRPAFFGQPDVPESVVAHARALGVELLVAGRDLTYRGHGTHWECASPYGRHFGLPYPALRGPHQLANATLAIAALDTLKDRCPLKVQDIKRGLVEVDLPARFQVLPGRPAVVLDVAHNPDAAATLARVLSAMGRFPATHAVFGMLKDKDVGGVVDALRDVVTRWHAADLEGPRGATAERLADELRARGIAGVETHASVADAWRAACGSASADDRIVVFGSFLTVAHVLRARSDK